MTTHTPKSKRGVIGSVVTFVTVASFLWEERGLIKRIFKEAGKQINKHKNKS